MVPVPRPSAHAQSELLASLAGDATVLYNCSAMADESKKLELVVSQLTKELAKKEAELKAAKLSPQASDAMPLLWKGCPRLPCGFVRPHVAVKDRCVYVGGGNATKIDNSRTVFKFDSQTWSRLPITPYYMFSLTVVKGQVTVVGGVTVVSSSMSNALASFNEEESKKWAHRLPAMPTKRCATSATSTESYLVVVGGLAENNRSYLATVEVLNLSTLVWSAAQSLPRPVTFMSITNCSVSNRIYLMGGLTREGAIRTVFSCVIHDLVNSTPGGSKRSTCIWEEMTEAPYFRSGCAAINGKLITASGLSGDNETTTTVFAFDPTTKEWKALGEMAAARSSCSLAVLSDSEVMVVGGYVDPRSWQTSLTRDAMQCVNLRIP